MHRLLLASCVALSLLAPPTVARAAACVADEYVVTGTVRNTVGHTLADADVYVLIDKVSQKAYLQQGGFRGRSFRTGGNGGFRALVVCGGQPDPCAAKPKHVTLAVTAGGHRMRLVTYKLKSMSTEKNEAGVCSVRVPDLVLTIGR